MTFDSFFRMMTTTRSERSLHLCFVRAVSWRGFVPSGKRSLPINVSFGSNVAVNLQVTLRRKTERKFDRRVFRVDGSVGLTDDQGLLLPGRQPVRQILRAHHSKQRQKRWIFL